MGGESVNSDEEFPPPLKNTTKYAANTNYARNYKVIVVQYRQKYNKYFVNIRPNSRQDVSYHKVEISLDRRSFYILFLERNVHAWW